MTLASCYYYIIHHKLKQRKCAHQHTCSFVFSSNRRSCSQSAPFLQAEWHRQYALGSNHSPEPSFAEEFQGGSSGAYCGRDIARCSESACCCHCFSDLLLRMNPCGSQAGRLLHNWSLIRHIPYIFKHRQNCHCTMAATNVTIRVCSVCVCICWTLPVVI